MTAPESDNAEENKEGEIEEYQDGIKPSSFKYYFGKGHQDFSSNKQQDAFEYFSGNIAQQVGSITFRLLSYSLLSAHLCEASSLFSIFFQKFNYIIMNIKMYIKVYLVT